jgi:hypothetical protein
VATVDETQDGKARAEAPAAVPHLTVAERAERGRAGRRKSQRTSHAALEL